MRNELLNLYDLCKENTNDKDIVNAFIRKRDAVASQIIMREILTCETMKKMLLEVVAKCSKLEELVDIATLAIGEHNSPGDCYATGPLTGNPVTDLVMCPACRFIAMKKTLMEEK